MSRSSLMLATLQRAHGGWVSRAELFNDAGCFYLTNNASSELRADGYNVPPSERVNGLVSYRLVGSVGADGATDAGGGVPAGSLGSSASPPPGSLSEGVHDRSRETPETPLGAHADGDGSGLPFAAPASTDSSPPSLSTISRRAVVSSSTDTYAHPPERSSPIPSPGTAGAQLSFLTEEAA